MGEWLARKWYHCQEMMHDAERELKGIGIPISVLREQWLQQIQTQTKPTPREFHLFVPTFVELFQVNQSSPASGRWKPSYCWNKISRRLGNKFVSWNPSFSRMLHSGLTQLRHR
jgi:hypothetical protein